MEGCGGEQVGGFDRFQGRGPAGVAGEGSAESGGGQEAAGGGGGEDGAAVGFEVVAGDAAQQVAVATVGQRRSPGHARPAGQGRGWLQVRLEGGIGAGDLVAASQVFAGGGDAPVKLHAPARARAGFPVHAGIAEQAHRVRAGADEAAPALRRAGAGVLEGLGHGPAVGVVDLDQCRIHVFVLVVPAHGRRELPVRTTGRLSRQRARPTDRDRSPPRDGPVGAQDMSGCQNQPRPHHVATAEVRVVPFPWRAQAHLYQPVQLPHAPRPLDLALLSALVAIPGPRPRSGGRPACAGSGAP